MTTTSKPKPTLEQYEAFERERQEEFFHQVTATIGCSEATIIKRFYDAWEKSQAKERSFLAMFGVTPDRAASVLYGDGGW